MDEIDEAIMEHKRNCQELNDEKFKNISSTLERMEGTINLLLKFSSKNLVLETRLNILEEAINKRPEKTISIIGFAITILLAMYVIIPKIAK